MRNVEDFPIQDLWNAAIAMENCKHCVIQIWRIFTQVTDNGISSGPSNLLSLNTFKLPDGRHLEEAFSPNAPNDILFFHLVFLLRVDSD